MSKTLPLKYLFMKQYYLKLCSLLFLCFILLICIQGCKNKLAADRYLKMKVKPSDQLRLENQEVLEKSNKAYKKQLEKNKEDIKENNKKALSMKKRYHLHRTKKIKKENIN